VSWILIAAISEFRRSRQPPIVSVEEPKRRPTDHTHQSRDSSVSGPFPKI
ncbi:integral membrane protein, partial [Colletotrichum musicola]